jgi:hypothetical protein
MKRLLAYLFIVLGLGLVVSVKADDIRDFQIEGMSIGDSLLDYFSEEEINKKKKTDYPGSKKFSRVDLSLSKYEIYDSVQFHFKAEDKNYIIYSLAGMIFYKNNIENCYDKKNKIVGEITELLKEAEIRDKGTRPHSGDKTGESTTNTVFFDFKSGDSVKVACFDWSEKFELEKKFTDNLRLAIGSKEIKEWLRNEAF